MPRPPLPRELEHVAMPDQIGLDVGAGILDAVANAGLGAEVDDARRYPMGVGEALSASASAKSTRSNRNRSPKSRGEPVERAPA